MLISMKCVLCVCDMLLCLMMFMLFVVMLSSVLMSLLVSRFILLMYSMLRCVCVSRLGWKCMLFLVSVCVRLSVFVICLLFVDSGSVMNCFFGSNLVRLCVVVDFVVLCGLLMSMLLSDGLIVVSSSVCCNVFCVMSVVNGKIVWVWGVVGLVIVVFFFGVVCW